MTWRKIGRIYCPEASSAWALHSFMTPPPPGCAAATRSACLVASGTILASAGSVGSTLMPQIPRRSRAPPVARVRDEGVLCAGVLRGVSPHAQCLARSATPLRRSLGTADRYGPLKPGEHLLFRPHRNPAAKTDADPQPATTNAAGRGASTSATFWLAWMQGHAYEALGRLKHCEKTTTITACSLRRKILENRDFGELAEWLRNGLQIRVQEFDSPTRLQ